MTLKMRKSIVVNTGPVLALVAGLGNLDILGKLYKQVFITKEVANEIMFKGLDGFAAKEFQTADFLVKIKSPLIIQPFLRNSLDPGEASVIQYALENKINLVCIDESAGRRMARLSELELTGSIGILLRAKKEGLLSSIKPVIEKMLEHGIFLSSNVMSFALKEAGEID